MDISTEIHTLWEAVLNKFDLKNKFIRFSEHKDEDSDELMYVRDSKLTVIESDNVEYILKGISIISYNSADYAFSVQNVSHTYHFGLKDLLTGNQDIENIRIISSEEFLDTLQKKYNNVVALFSSEQDEHYIKISSDKATQRQIVALQVLDKMEKWFDGLSEEDKEKFGEEFPVLVTPKISEIDLSDLL